MPDEKLLRSLGMLSEVMEEAQDPWWIIGSAAVALHGGKPGTVADIDVITSRREFDMLSARLALQDMREEGKPQFYSQAFGRWDEPPLAVEFMAGFSMLEDDEWRAVELKTRQKFSFEGCAVFVPEREELIALLHRFGREKDFARAATLGG